MKSTRPVYIYGLVDPRTGDVRYVGKSINPVRRMTHHMWEARAFIRGTLKLTDQVNLRKTKWMAQVIESGSEPRLVILQDCDDQTWEAAEQEMILALRSSGFPLLNVASGGVGFKGPKPITQKVKIAIARRGFRQPEDAKERLRQKNLARHDAGCVHGHPWTEANTRCKTLRKHDGSPRSVRVCRICEWMQRPTQEETGRVPRASRFLTELDAELIAGRDAPPRIKDTCVRGHPWTPENTIYQGQSAGRLARACRECKKLRSNARYRASHPPQAPHETCPSGHQWTEDNIKLLWNGERMARRCRTCLRERDQAYKRRKRLERQLPLPLR